MEVYPTLLKNSIAFKADGSINRRAVLNFWRGHTMETFEGEYNKIIGAPVSDKYLDKSGVKPKRYTIHESLYNQYKKLQYTLSLLCLESGCINPSFLKKIRMKVAFDLCNGTPEHSYVILILKDIETVKEKIEEIKRKSRALSRAEKESAAVAASAVTETEPVSEAETVVEDWEALL